MAELAIKIGASTYEDGDVLCAFNDRRIRCAHAQHICHVKEAGFTRDGLRPNESLAEKMLQRTRQYRIERISRNEVKRITLATMAEEILSDKPNEKGEYIHVEEFFKRRLAHARHAVFGSPGREVMYGGRTYHEDARLMQVWNDIETHSSWREANHRRWPAGSDDLRVHFFVAVDNMDDAISESLVSVAYDEKKATDKEGKVVLIKGLDDPKIDELELQLITLKKRKHNVPWRALSGLSIGTKADIMNPSKQVDIREAMTFNRLQVVQAKLLAVEMQ